MLKKDDERRHPYLTPTIVLSHSHVLLLSELHLQPRRRAAQWCELFCIDIIPPDGAP